VLLLLHGGSHLQQLLLRQLRHGQHLCPDQLDVVAAWKEPAGMPLVTCCGGAPAIAALMHAGTTHVRVAAPRHATSRLAMHAAIATDVGVAHRHAAAHLAHARETGNASHVHHVG